MFVGIEYFSRWFEAKLVAKNHCYSSPTIRIEIIIYKNGVLRDIVIDNDTQFNFACFKAFCGDL